MTLTNNEDDINIDLGKELAANPGNDCLDDTDNHQLSSKPVPFDTDHPSLAEPGSTTMLDLALPPPPNAYPKSSEQMTTLLNRLKDLEYDNFRLEKRLSETLSRQWRIETLFQNYVFNQVVRDKYEQSKYYCQGNTAENTAENNSTYFVHFVDYLGSNSFRRIQDALDIANDFDKIVVAAGVYTESLTITKQIILIANGYVEIKSAQGNVITCSAGNEGCLVKGFTIRRVDG